MAAEDGDRPPHLREERESTQREGSRATSAPAPARSASAHRRLVENDVAAAAEGENTPPPPGHGPAARPISAAGDVTDFHGRRHLVPTTQGRVRGLAPAAVATGPAAAWRGGRDLRGEGRGEGRGVPTTVGVEAAMAGACEGRRGPDRFGLAVRPPAWSGRGVKES